MAISPKILPILAIFAIMIIPTTTMSIIASASSDTFDEDCNLSDLSALCAIDSSDILDLSHISQIENLPDLFNSLTSDNVIILPSFIISALNDSDLDHLKGSVKNGTALIVIGDAHAIQLMGLSAAINKNSTCSLIYYDQGMDNTYCYSIEAEDFIPSTINWIKSMMIHWLDSVKSALTDQPVDYNHVLFYKESKVCGDGGQINVTGVYSYLGTSNGYAYYSVQYIMESILRKSSWGTADMTVTCDVDSKNAFQHLIDYGPDNTITTETGETSVSLSVGTSGISLGVSTSWSYSVPNTVVHNQCNTSEDYFRIWHDTDERMNDTIRIKPGAIVSVSTGSEYVSDDVYTVQYQKPYEKHFWPWDPVNEMRTYTLTASTLVNMHQS